MLNYGSIIYNLCHINIETFKMDYALKAIIGKILQETVMEHKMGFATGLSLNVEKNTITIREFGRGIPFEAIMKLSKNEIEDDVTLEDFEQGRYRVLYGALKAAFEISSEYYLCSYSEGYSLWVRYSEGKLVGWGPKETPGPSGFLLMFSPEKDKFSDNPFSIEEIEQKVMDCAKYNPEMKVLFNEKHFSK